MGNKDTQIAAISGADAARIIKGIKAFEGRDQTPPHNHDVGDDSGFWAMIDDATTDSVGDAGYYWHEVTAVASSTDPTGFITTPSGRICSATENSGDLGYNVGDSGNGIAIAVPAGAVVRMWINYDPFNFSPQYNFNYSAPDGFWGHITLATPRYYTGSEGDDGLFFYQWIYNWQQMMPSAGGYAFDGWNNAPLSGGLGESNEILAYNAREWANQYGVYGNGVTASDLANVGLQLQPVPTTALIWFRKVLRPPYRGYYLPVTGVPTPGPVGSDVGSGIGAPENKWLVEYWFEFENAVSGQCIRPWDYVGSY